MLLIINSIFSGKLLANEKTIIIGVAEFPPYVIKEGYQLKDNNIGYGIDLDILIEAIKRANYQYKIKFYPFARIKISLKNNVIDVTPSMFLTDDFPANKHVLYDSDGTISFYQLAKNAKVIANVAALKGKTIGIVRGDFYGDQFTKTVNELKLTLTETKNDKQNFEMLLHERVDLLAINSVAGQFLTKQMTITDLVSETPLKLDYDYQGKNEGVHFLFRKSIGQEIVEDIRRAVKSIHEDDFIKRLKLDYGIIN